MIFNFWGGSIEVARLHCAKVCLECGNHVEEVGYHEVESITISRYKKMDIFVWRCWEVH